MALSREEVMSLGRRYAYYFGGMTARDLYEKTEFPPRFEVSEDAEAWTGERNGEQVIHIGLGLLDKYDDGTPVCEDEAAFLAGMRFLTGHEAGHQKYTTDRAWNWAIRSGIMEFTAYAVKERTGNSIRLAKESDAKAALQMLARKYGMIISYGAVQNVMHSVANIIEDGRMERMCCEEKPGFKSDVIFWRGGYWLHTPCRETKVSDDGEYFNAVLSQILFYATCGIWQKGFSEHFAGTRVETRIRSLQPLIEKGVSENSCKKGMTAALLIMRDLFPDLYKAFTNSEFSKALEDLLKSGAVVMALPDMSAGEGMPQPCGASEKEDAEREKAPEGKGRKMNIFDSEDPSGKEESAGNAAGSKKEEGNGKAAGDKPGDEKKSKPGSSAGEEKNDSPKEGANGRDNRGRSEKASKGGASGSKGQKCDRYDPNEKQVRDAMEKAALDMQGMCDAAVSSVLAFDESMDAIVPNVDTSSVYTRVGRGKVEEMCPRYHEYTRAYNLDINLPYDIREECSIVRRQYEKYFRSRKKPARRNQRSGKIDAHALHRLARGEMEFKMKKAEDNSFSGCIEILLDNSGSMSGGKKTKACHTLARVEETLKGLVPVKIAAFDYSGGVNVEVIKNWEEVQKKNCSWNYMKKSRTGGGTPTAEVLSISALEILKRHEKHKLIVLLTDEAYGCEGENLKRIIRQTREAGVQLAAIYFEHKVTAENAARFCGLFDNLDAVVCSPEQIGEKLLPVIRTFTHQ